jgi:small conductance mechanosensitive channel
MIIDTIKSTLNMWFAGNEPLKLIFVMIVTAVVAYWLSKFVANSIIWVAKRIAGETEVASSEEKFIQLRRVETYLSVSVALVRFGVVVGAVLFAWTVLSDTTSTNANAATAIGASAIFAVLAGATIGPLLRDITSGSTMIIERWFDVGDFVQVEPFLDVKGVVERLTLRSTRIRSISGEVIWLHNQHIQGVRVTPRGVRTMAVDIFVHDVEQAKKALSTLLVTLKAGPTMLAAPLRIVETEKLAPDFWRMTIVGQTAPGREWLIDDFFVNALKAIDKEEEGFNIAYGPMVRYADEAAEKRFRRAVHVKQAEQDETAE